MKPIEPQETNLNYAFFKLNDMTSHIFSIICCCSATWNLFYALNTMCNPLQVDQRQRDGKEKIWKLEGFILYIIFSVLSYLSNIVSIFFINLQQRHIT